MPTEKSLEQYLTALDKALSEIPISDRAEIVTEIKSHVLEARERDPKQSLEGILQTLGEPESVASRYLLERGLKPAKVPLAARALKWVAFSIVGTVGFIVLLVIFLIWKFTPIIKVDGEKGRVSILGGLIDLDEENSKYHDEGSRTLTDSDKELRVDFHNGKMSLRPALGKQLSWDCRYRSSAGVLTLAQKPQMPGVLLLPFGDTPGVKCILEIPAGLKTSLTGSNGYIELERPAGEVAVELENGMVSMEPDSTLAYRYELRVQAGMVDKFVSSTAAKALPITVKLEHGRIAKVYKRCAPERGC